MADHTTAFISNQGSVSTPFKAPATSTRSEPSAVSRRSSAESHDAQTSSNRTTVSGLEDSGLEEDNEVKVPVTQTMPEGTSNASAGRADGLFG